MISRRLVVRILLAFLFLTFSISLVYSQSGTTVSQPSRHRKTNKIKLFSENDKPKEFIAAKISHSDKSKIEKVLRHREAFPNLSVLVGSNVVIERGDILVGEFFSGFHVEAKVYRIIKDRDKTVYLSNLLNSRNDFTLTLERGKLDIWMTSFEEQRNYHCYYDTDTDKYYIEEKESKFAVIKRRKRAIEDLKKQGPKTIQLFDENDDATSRIGEEEPFDREEHLIRMRKAYVNPQLFSDKFDEIHVGDIISGYLFEDEYFEGKVQEKIKNGIPALRLKITAGRFLTRQTLLSCNKDSLYLRVEDYERSRDYTLGSYKDEDFHIIEEFDSSKRVKLEGSNYPGNQGNKTVGLGGDRSSS